MTHDNTRSLLPAVSPCYPRDGGQAHGEVAAAAPAVVCPEVHPRHQEADVPVCGVLVTPGVEPGLVLAEGGQHGGAVPPVVIKLRRLLNLEMHDGKVDLGSYCWIICQE